MKTASEQIEGLVSATGEYIDTKTELLRYQVVDKLSDAVSSVITGVILLSIFVFFFFIINIGLGILVGQWLGQIYYGFFLIAGFYAIVGLLCFVFRKKWFKEPVANLLIQKLLK